jgi:5-methylcytosine-specific restriction enzyme subunit McrC
MPTSVAEPEPIRLSEYQPKSVLLSDEDRAYLVGRFNDRLRLTVQLVDGGAVDVIDPGPNVGVLMLPSGRRIECRPKVDAANIFYMMAVAHELPDLEEELAEYDRFDDLLEFVVARFATLAEERIQQGLHRQYLEREENLGAVRGRILVAPDLRHNFALRHRTYCEFAELSWDIPENQVVRQVAYQMAGWSFRPELRSRLTQIESVLAAEVSPTKFSASVVDSFVYSRLNYEYRPLHQLCRLLLDASSFHEEAGAFEFQTFLVDMNDLFERYVAKVLDQWLTSGEFRVHAQWNDRLDVGRKVRIIPDIVFSRSGVPILAMDTKYKRLEQGEFKNHDLYQMLSYCTALQLDKGVLVYPRHLMDIEQDVLVRNSSMVIREMTLDLSGGVTDLQLATTRFAARIGEWSAGSW